ncbi:unnamed protein product [Gongylonema pulchrum]|uniref:Secreted protein n=1 Tax=Gongylonema pulchrum TaxID=637853 RepID=A0A183EID4_9BILA|nr:unnamed protein product [Gongylonema pulchrum]
MMMMMTMVMAMMMIREFVAALDCCAGVVSVWEMAQLTLVIVLLGLLQFLIPSHFYAPNTPSENLYS